MAVKYPVTLEELMRFCRRLPGVGRRGAERMAFALLQWKPDELHEFGNLIAQMPESVTFCPVCGNIAEFNDECDICQDRTRDDSTLCVVEEFSQITAFENGKIFRWRYHVLGGTLSPLAGRSDEDLAIDSLLRRIDSGNFKEIIIALGGDVEGQATTVYLKRLLAGRDLKVTQLARGLPATFDIAYADAATLSVALSGRTTVE